MNIKLNCRASAPLILMICVGNAAAATFATTRFDDPAPVACSAQSCSLREAILAANASAGADVITLGSGDYMLSHSSLQMTISDALQIIGKGKTQSRILGNFSVTNATSRLMSVSNTQLTLVDLSLERGMVYAGVPIFSGGCLHSVNSTLTFSRVGISACAGASALTLIGGRSQLDEVQIHDNKGAGIWLSNHVSQGTEVAIFGNTAIEICGGGIRSSDSLSQLRWAKSVISKNQASLGAGVCIASGSLRLSAPSGQGLLRIEQNNATKVSGLYGYGGGVHVQASGYLYGERLRLNANTAQADGGGLDLDGSSQPGTGLYLSDSEIIGNLSDGSGGGISLRGTGGAIKIERASFAANFAGGVGGGIASAREGLRLSNVSTYNNFAAIGGGMSLSKASVLTHVSSLETDAGALSYSALIEIQNSVLVGGCNNAGGGTLNPTAVLQASGYPNCSGTTTASLPSLLLSYGNVGAAFNAVRFTGTSSPLYNSGLGLPLTVDIANKARMAPVDIGAFEW